MDGLIPGYTETRRFVSANIGELCGGGILGPNSKVTFGTIVDGSSNVMLVGEQSTFYFTTTGAKKDWRTSGGLGFQIGVGTTSEVTSTPPNFTGNPFTFNFYTVRYPINKNRGWADPSGTMAIGVGQINPTSYITAINLPLNSAHPGGIVVVLGDGSVRFVGETTTLTALAQLATRDDGTPLGDF